MVERLGHHLQRRPLAAAEARWSEALSAYENAIEYKESQVYGIALYKIGWCHYNLANYDKSIDTLLVHAGTHPEWSVKKTLARAAEVEAALQGLPSIALSQFYRQPPEGPEDTWAASRATCACSASTPCLSVISTTPTWSSPSW